jgi:HSP20 family protein
MLPAKKSNRDWLPSIFQDFFGNEWIQKTSFSNPAINIIESDKEYKIEVAAPGMTKDDFVVKLENENELTVSFEKKEEKENEKDGKYLRREFSFSQFKQTMFLPDNIDCDKIEAKVNNGVLKISIPRKERKEPKTNGKLIDIK